MTLNKEENLTLAEKRAKLENEKLTRRQALARFGFQAGAAAVAALTADDLLRKVGEELQRRSGDNKVVQQVAKELNSAGVAFAATATNCALCGCSGSCDESSGIFKSMICTGTTACTNDCVFCGLNCNSNDPNCGDCCQEKYDACVAAYGPNSAACDAKRLRCIRSCGS